MNEWGWNYKRNQIESQGQRKVSQRRRPRPSPHIFRFRFYVFYVVAGLIRESAREVVVVGPPRSLSVSVIVRVVEPPVVLFVFI